MTKLTKKNKFIDTQFKDYNKQIYVDIGNKNCENENKLLFNTLQSKEKTEIKLKDKLDPFDYELDYSNLRKDTKGDKEFIYYSAYNQGPGHGFGNLQINNNIRLGEASRIKTIDFKLSRESEIQDRFSFIDNRYSDASNLVLPFPRSGELTRKSTYFNNDLNLSEQNKYNSDQPRYNNSGQPRYSRPNENIFDYNN